MLEQYAAPSEGEVLLEINLLPSEELSHKGRPEQNALIETLTGRRNLVLVGVPQVVDLLSVWPKGAGIAKEIAPLRKAWEFHTVRLACSFVPDRGCRFFWARLKVELMHPEGVVGGCQPLAFDLFPRIIEHVEEYRRSFKILPTFKFAFGQISTELAGEKEALRYEPHILAAGLLTSTPIWTFQSTTRQGIAGGYDLFLLLQKPKGSPVHARFLAAAEISTHLGRIPLGRYGNPDLIDRTFPLVP